jgi:nucleoredoxin
LKKIYLNFFSRAHWCPPCRKFTPILAKTFKEVHNETKDKLDIIFVSCDEDQEGFDEYFKEMPWKALPFSGMSNSCL